jgi:hypothetical protein
VIGSLDALGALQVRSTSRGPPVPLRDTVKVGFGGELLLTINWPVYDPVAPGSNRTFSVSDCPGLNVAGSVAPETEKPLPLTLAEFTVTGAVPVELSITGCDTAVFTSTLPNPSDVPLTLKDAAPVEGEMVMLNVVDTPPATAVIVATCVVATLATVAVNPAVIASGLTATPPGTLTAGLLLVRVTRNLLLVVDVRYTEQASVDAPL